MNEPSEQKKILSGTGLTACTWVKCSTSYVIYLIVVLKIKINMWKEPGVTQILNNCTFLIIWSFRTELAKCPWTMEKNWYYLRLKVAAQIRQGKLIKYSNQCLWWMLTIQLPEVRHINLYPALNMIFLGPVPGSDCTLIQCPCTEKISADLHVSRLLRGNTRVFSGHSPQYNKCKKLNRGRGRWTAMASVVDNF